MATIKVGYYDCDYLLVDKTNYIHFVSDETIFEIENGSTEHERIFTYNQPISFFENLNYCMIDNDYYFITKKKIADGNMTEITCEIDPLMSYKDLIYDSTQLVTRNAKNRNAYLVDNEMTFTNYDLIDCYEFPNAINNDSIILITVG